MYNGLMVHHQFHCAFPVLESFFSSLSAHTLHFLIFNFESAVWGDLVSIHKSSLIKSLPRSMLRRWLMMLTLSFLLGRLCFLRPADRTTGGANFRGLSGSINWFFSTLFGRREKPLECGRKMDIINNEQDNEGKLRNLKKKTFEKMLIICQDFVRFCGSRLNFQWTRLCKSSIFFLHASCRERFSHEKKANTIYHCTKKVRLVSDWRWCAFLWETTDSGGRWVHEHLMKIVVGFTEGWEAVHTQEVIVMNNEGWTVKNLCI